MKKIKQFGIIFGLLATIFFIIYLFIVTIVGIQDYFMVGSGFGIIDIIGSSFLMMFLSLLLGSPALIVVIPIYMYMIENNKNTYFNVFKLTFIPSLIYMIVPAFGMYAITLGPISGLIINYLIKNNKIGFFPY